MPPPDQVRPAAARRPRRDAHAAQVVKPPGPPDTFPALSFVSGCHWFEPTMTFLASCGLADTVSSPSAKPGVPDTSLTGGIDTAAAACHGASASRARSTTGAATPALRLT